METDQRTFDNMQISVPSHSSSSDSNSQPVGYDTNPSYRDQGQQKYFSTVNPRREDSWLVEGFTEFKHSWWNQVHKIWEESRPVERNQHRQKQRIWLLLAWCASLWASVRHCIYRDEFEQPALSRSLWRWLRLLIVYSVFALSLHLPAWKFWI